MLKRRKALALASALAVTIIASFSIPAVSANDRVIVVQPGQTLSQIAMEHGMTVARLVALNHLADPDLIYPGQQLRLRPGPGSVKRHERLITHRISFGETLSGIAVRYRTTIAAIARSNDISDPSRIFAGQLLRIADGRGPGVRHGPARDGHAPSVGIHTVQYGQTLSGIAMRYRVSIASIVIANRIADPSFIQAGAQLRIPGRPDLRPAAGHGSSRHASGTGMPAGMAALVAQRAEMRRLIAAESRRQGVPISFALAVAWQESGWQPAVVSSAGAVGVMQLLPATGDWIAATMLGEPVNVWDASSNVRAGVRLLRHYLDRYGGSRSLALAAYYQGQAATDAHGIYPVSQPYISSILILQDLFRH